MQILIKTNVSSEKIAQYQALAKGTSVTFANPESSVWFEAWVDDKLAGVCCLVLDTGRCKSSIVHPDFRRRGIFSALFAARVKLAMQSGVKRLTAYSSTMSQPKYIAQGFVIKGATKASLFMVKELFK
jgi:GNAT superfamily N-acetyltransferase